MKAHGVRHRPSVVPSVSRAEVRRGFITTTVREVARWRRADLDRQLTVPTAAHRPKRRCQRPVRVTERCPHKGPTRTVPGGSANRWQNMAAMSFVCMSSSEMTRTSSDNLRGRGCLPEAAQWGQPAYHPHFICRIDMYKTI